MGRGKGSMPAMPAPVIMERPEQAEYLPDKSKLVNCDVPLVLIPPPLNDEAVSIPVTIAPVEVVSIVLTAL